MIACCCLAGSSAKRSLIFSCSGWTFFIFAIVLAEALAMGKVTALTQTVSRRMASPKLPSSL